MNTTTLRITKYAGAGVAALATTCVLAAPATAMRPEPVPRTNQQAVPTTTDHESPSTPSIGSSSDGFDWSTLAAGLGGGAMLTGVVVIGASELRRRQARPA
jgi:hypothetical protein